MMFRKTSQLTLLQVAVLSLATQFCGNALAQSTSEDGAESLLLEEVIVTAQRRETDVMQTALAVSVLSGGTLEAKGVDNLLDVQFATPSVVIADYGSANVFNIRGIGRSKVDIEIPSGVVIYQDGVPTVAGYFQNEPYYDIAAIEVLRGPQGTFVGKSASGGAIFVRTRNPELGGTSGNLEVGAGDYSLWEGRGFANMGSDTFAFRAAFNYENRDDWYDSITGDYTGDPGSRDLLSLRLGFLWQPNDSLSVLFKYSYADLDFGGNVTSSYGDDPYNVPQNAPFAYKDKGDRYVLDIDYSFDSGIKFSSLTGYSTVDTINNLDLNGSIQEPIYWFKSGGTIDLFSQEFNLISPDDAAVRWVLGAFYQNQKADLYPVDQFGFTFIGGDPFGTGQLPLDYPWLGSPWTKDEDDWAVFGHVAYDLTQSLELEAGLRYSEYDFYQITEYVFGFGDAPPEIPFLSEPPGPDRQDFDENSTDWKVGLNWTRDENNYIYGLISRGHTWGSVNIFPPWDPYDQMKVYNYEAGWKAAWNDQRFLTQLSGYYETVTDYQAAFTDLDIPNSAGQVQNASTDSTIYGIELTAQANLDAWSLEFGISWNESELGDFNNVVNPITLETENVSGAPFPLAPDFTANLGISYTYTFSNGSTLVPRMDYGYVADSYADLFVVPQLHLPSRSLLNLNVRWEFEQWYASLWATNLTDERYIAAIQNNGSLYYAGPPRQWGVRVGYNF